MIKVNGIEVTKGCTVKTNCAVFVVQDLDNNDDVLFEGYGEYITYYEDGSYERRTHPLDIIEVIPPVFDWKDAKAGMAFTHVLWAKDDIFIFIAPIGEEKVMCAMPRDGIRRGTSVVSRDILKGYLTRAPEHDIIEEKDQ